jgi:MFS family permease
VRLRAGILDGLRAVFGHKIIRVVTLAATVGALAGQMQAVVLVLYLVRDLGLSASLVGAVVAAGGAAGILGALRAARITQRIGQGPAFITGMFLASSGGLVLAAAAGPLPLTLAILVIAQVLRGAGPSLYGVNQQTFRQALIPAVLLSRANATWRFLVFGMQPAGALLGGLTGSAVNLRATLIISSAIMLGGTAIAFASPLRTLRGLPAQQENDGGRRAALSGRARFAQLVMPAASPRRTPAWRTTAWQG